MSRRPLQSLGAQLSRSYHTNVPVGRRWSEAPVDQLGARRPERKMAKITEPIADPCVYFTTPGGDYINVDTSLLADKFTIGVKVSDWVSGPVYLQLYTQDVCDGWYQATLVDGWWCVTRSSWCTDTLTVYANDIDYFDGSLLNLTDARVCASDALCTLSSDDPYSYPPIISQGPTWCEWGPVNGFGNAVYLSLIAETTYVGDISMTGTATVLETYGGGEWFYDPPWSYTLTGPWSDPDPFLWVDPFGTMFANLLVNIRWEWDIPDAFTSLCLVRGDAG